MTLVSAAGVGKTFGTQLCFQGVKFSVSEATRAGLIGSNGTGKTTLLHIIRGGIEHEGTVSRRRDLRVAMLDQHPHLPEGMSVRDAMLDAAEAVAVLEKEMEALHERLADDPPDKADLLSQLEEKQQLFDREGGYVIENQVEKILLGVGFPKSRFDDDVKVLSGGEKNRLALGRLLLVEPDLWLLDEPTNHLDLEGIQFLESFLRESRAAAVVVSHDRRFLDTMTTETWELEGNQMFTYPAPYTRARKLREERLKAEWKEYEKQLEWIAKEEDFIRRFKAGQRSKEAKGRERRLDRLERLPQPGSPVQVMNLKLPMPESLGAQVLEITSMAKSFGSLHLFDGVNLEVEPGETVGIVGPNGAGKTTMLRILLGEIEADRGEIRWGSRVRKGVLRQHDEFPETDTTPFLFLRKCAPKRVNQELRDVLGAMLFKGDEVEKNVDVLSGGEKKRLMFTRLLLEGNNLLLLDEPTNHLDLASREVVEYALTKFEGTILVVSHDRYFLDQVCDRILWLEAGEWRVTHGGFQRAYEARPERKVLKFKKKVVKPEKVRLTPLQRMKTEVLEARIIELEEEIWKLQEKLGLPEVHRDAEKTAEVKGDIEGVERELAELNAEYEGRNF